MVTIEKLVDGELKYQDVFDSDVKYYSKRGWTVSKAEKKPIAVKKGRKRVEEVVFSETSTYGEE